MAKQLAKHFKRTNSRNESADRRQRSHEVFTDISQQAKKLFEDKDLLNSKGYLRLGEGGEAEKALRLLHQAFVERKLANISDVRAISKIKSDVYIKVISSFLPSHVGKWASDRQADRPAYDEDRNSPATSGGGTPSPPGWMPSAKNSK